jgi:type I restriction enzyme M protein
VSGFQDKVSFIWSIADLLRGDFKPSEYGKVILPFTVLRRRDELPGRLANFAQHLKRLPAELGEILDCFHFRETIARLQKAGLLPLILERFSAIDLDPASVSNHEMGYIFEELIRKFSEQSNEAAGEHFTPREVVRLMVRLVFQDDSGAGKTLYDPACGTGGMLAVAEEFARERCPDARLEIAGQELNSESYAICKADALLRGHAANSIALGNSFTHDAFAGRKFDYILSNPPFGVDWRKVEKQVRAECERLGFRGRFGAGLPRVNDGSLLFLQHMLSKMKPEGMRVAVVFHGSPLFAGDAGSGESDIRRWICENDWLEAIVALPDQLFYNTGLATYIWLLTNRKSAARQGKVQLINAITFSEKMPRSLGAKRNVVPGPQIDRICEIHRGFADGAYSRILPNRTFGCRRITIERPLRLCFQATPERIHAVRSKFAPPVIEALAGMDAETVYRDQSAFDAALKASFVRAGVKLGRTLARRIREALASQDDTAAVYSDAKHRPLPDPNLRDNADVPLDEDVQVWFDREVLPYAPDAWIAAGEPRIGYAIPFARFFFEPEPVRPLTEIDREIHELEHEARGLLQQLGTT